SFHLGPTHRSLEARWARRVLEIPHKKSRPQLFSIELSRESLSVEVSRPSLSEATVDEIDRVLAAHYGFTDEELDFPSMKLRAGIPSTRLRTSIPSARLRAGDYDIR